MSLEDYIRKNEEERKKQEEKRKNQPPEGCTYLYEVNTYKIPEEIVELIEDYGNYIEEYLLDNNEEYKNMGGAVLQIKTNNNKRMAVLVDLYETNLTLTQEELMERSHYETIIKISEKEYKEKIKNYVKVGSQRFHVLSFQYCYQRIKSQKMEKERIYYADDGYIYITPECAKKLQKIDIDELGAVLATKAEAEKAKAKTKRKDM